MRSFVAAYASNVPCRSRWSGSRFVSTAIRGASVSTSSSWNEESSHTIQASGDACPTSDVSGRPMLPATSTGTLARLEDRAEQRGRRRLPVRAGDAEERIREQPRAELDLRDDRDARARGRPTIGSALGRHAGALDDEPDPVEQRVVPGAERSSASRPATSTSAIGVVGDDVAPRAAERVHRSPAGARETDDEHALGQLSPSREAHQRLRLRSRAIATPADHEQPRRRRSAPSARSSSTIAASAKPESGWRNCSVAIRAIPPRSSAQYQPT